MIEVFKMVNNKYDSNLQPSIMLKDLVNIRNTRLGNSKKLYKERCQKEVRRNFFRNRTITLWNDLPNKVIEALSIKSFEKRLDKYSAQFKIKYNFESIIVWTMKINKKTLTMPEPEQEEKVMI